MKTLVLKDKAAVKSLIKPDTMIIDDVLSESPPWWQDRRAKEALAAMASRAERFVFSNSASALIGQFAIECPDLVLQHRQFAIPPFDTMYVEFKRSFFDKFPPNQVTGAQGSDIGLGYLVSGQRVYVLSRGVDGERTKAVPNAKNQVLWLPMYYTWAPPGETAPMDPIERGRPVMLDGEYGEWNHLAMIAGAGVSKITDEDMRQSLLKEVRAHLSPLYSQTILKKSNEALLHDSVHRIIRSTSGDMRNLWAALLWLNRPTHTTVTNQPGGRRFFHGKQVAYKAHRVVEVDLHKHRSIRRAFVLSGERLSPRRHKVRGAFHHSGGEFACSHDWPDRPDVDSHWKCTKCGRLRWWVKDHVRGDATRGYVTHDEYSITTGAKK